MVDLYGNVQELVEKEIESIVKIGQLDQNSLCNLDKFVDIVKDIYEIREKESGYSESGYSRSGGHSRYYNDYGHSYDRGYSRYGDEQNRDRYMRIDYMDNRYSGHGDKEHMIRLLEEAMNNATTKDEKDQIMQMINKMDK